MSGLTRALTQKILIPLNMNSHAKDSIINKIFKSSSEAFTYSSKGEKSREDDFLDDKIKNIYIGFEKIGLPIHTFADIAFFPTRIFLPSEIPILSGKRWIHASILVITSKYSICVEYGAYDGEDIVDKNKNVYTTYYWFDNRHGIRYGEMSLYDYKHFKVDYEPIPLEIGRNMTLREALRECNNYNQKEWTFSNYDLANQNCQDFVAKFINRTVAYRRKGEGYRGLHNISSTKIPKVILKEIEENEDDGWNSAGKVPIVGPIIGAFYGIFSRI